MLTAAEAALYQLVGKATISCISIPSILEVMYMLMTPTINTMILATPKNEMYLNRYIFLMRTSGNYKTPTNNTMKYSVR